MSGYVKMIFVPFSSVVAGNTQIANINMYLLTDVSHNILIKYHGNFIQTEKLKIICLKLTFQEITHKKMLVS